MATGKFIAVANMKGGVGKTTTVVTLAESLLADDPSRRVLVVDLDSQASASVTIAGDDALFRIIEDGLTLQDYLESRLIEDDADSRLTRHIHVSLNNTWHQNRRLDVGLLPCGPHLRTVEKRIIYHIAESHGGFTAYEGRLNRLFTQDFTPLRKIYDYVVFDCPPGISSLSEVAIRNSDVIVMPTIPDRISVYGLSAMIQTIWDDRSKSPRKPVKPHILLARTQKTKKHQDMIDALEHEAGLPKCGFYLMKTRVPQLQSFANTLDVDHTRPISFASRYPKDMLGHMSNLLREVTEACHGV